MKFKKFKIINEVGEFSNFTRDVRVPKYDWNWSGFNWREVKAGKLHELTGCKVLYNALQSAIKLGNGTHTISGFEILVANPINYVKVLGQNYPILTGSSIDGLDNFDSSITRTAFIRVGTVNVYPHINSTYDVRWVCSYNELNNFTSIETSQYVELYQLNKVIKTDLVTDNAGKWLYKYRITEKNTTNITHIFEQYFIYDVVEISDAIETQVSIDWNTTDAIIGKDISNKKITDKTYNLSVSLYNCDKLKQQLILNHVKKIVAYSQENENKTFLQVANHGEFNVFDEDTFINQYVIIKSMTDSGYNHEEGSIIINFEVYAPVNVWFEGDKEINIDSNTLIPVPHVEEAPPELGWVLNRNPIWTLFAKRDLSIVRLYNTATNTMEWEHKNLAPAGVNLEYLGSQQLANGEEKTFLRNTNVEWVDLYTFNNAGGLVNIKMNTNGLNPQTGYTFTGVSFRNSIKFGTQNSDKYTFSFIYGSRRVVQVIMDIEAGTFEKKEYINTTNLGFNGYYVEPHSKNGLSFITFGQHSGANLRYLNWYQQAYLPGQTNMISTQTTLANFDFGGGTNVLGYYQNKTGRTTGTKGFATYGTLIGNQLYVITPKYDVNNLVEIRRVNTTTPNTFTVIYSISNLLTNLPESFDFLNKNLEFDYGSLTIENINDQYYNPTVKNNYIVLPSADNAGLRNWYRFDTNPAITPQLLDYNQVTAPFAPWIAKKVYGFINYSQNQLYNGANLLNTWTTDRSTFTYITNEHGTSDVIYYNEGEALPEVIVNLNTIAVGGQLIINNTTITFNQSANNVTLFWDFQQNFSIYYTKFFNGTNIDLEDASEIIDPEKSSFDIQMKPGQNTISLINCKGEIKIKEGYK